jgi:5'-3' exonuclease
MNNGTTDEELNKLASERMMEIVKRMIEEKSQKRVEKYVDKVQLGEDGWKLRYYKEKFHVDQQDIEEFIKNIR